MKTRIRILTVIVIILALLLGIYAQPVLAFT